MPSKLTLILIIGVISFGIPMAQAAPLARMTTIHSAHEHCTIERIAVRRCWKREGKKICRWVERRRAVAQRRQGENKLPPNLGLGFGSGM